MIPKFKRLRWIICFILINVIIAVCLSLLFKQIETDTQRTYYKSTWTNSLKYFQNDFNTVTTVKTRFKFLNEYKNPCWFEPVTNETELENESKHICDNGFTSLINYQRLKIYYRKKRENDEQNPQQLSCLPYFMLIGVSKSGSSDLYYRIIKHPQIAAPLEKETRWWSCAQCGEIILKRYIRFFAESAIPIETNVEYIHGTEYHPMVTGEGSPQTSWRTDHWEQYPGNENLTEPVITNAHLIRQLIPDVKIIIIMRHPVERVLSDYLSYEDNKTKSADLFHEKVKQSVELYTNCMSSYSARFCFYSNILAPYDKAHLRPSMYAVYIKDWLAVFPKHQIMIIRTEDYSTNRLSTLDEIYNFLQLKKLPIEHLQRITKGTKINSGKISLTPHNKTLKMLYQFFSPFNRQLVSLLNDRRFLWDDTIN